MWQARGDENRDAADPSSNLGKDTEEDGSPEWELGSTWRRRSSRLYQLRASACAFDKDRVTTEVLEITKKAKGLIEAQACVATHTHTYTHTD